MKQVSGKRLKSLIEEKGWVLVRIKGSHHIFAKAGRRERIVIPVHGNQPLKIGLLRAAMKVAGISEEEL